MQEKYLTTGEFARICGVEKHVLFHYEEIELFRPALVLENGYRYYSYHQYDTFAVIRTLKSLGMSLADIRVYLEQRTPALFLDLLAQKDRDLQDEILRLKTIRSSVANIRAMIGGILEEKPDVHLRRLEETQILLSENLEGSAGRSFADFMRQYIRFSRQHHVSMQEFVGNMITVDNLRRGDYMNFSYLFTYTDGKALPGDVRKHGIYLCALHCGEYEQIPNTYQKMLAWAEERKIPLGEYAYEEYVVADIAQKEPAGYMTRLLMETQLQEISPSV